MLSKDQLLALGAPDPELTAHLASNPFPGVPWHDLPLFREHTAKTVERVKGILGETPADLDDLIQPVKTRDGHTLHHRIVRPKSFPPPSGRPLILLIHGGGFITGNNITQVPLARPLARLMDAVVVTLQYRLAPEHKFPTQQEDIIDSVSWLATNAEEMLGANPESAGFILGGSSAGGQLSAVVMQYLADEGFTPRITGLWQNITVLLDESIVPAKYRDNWVSRTDPNCAEAVILSSKDVGVVDGHWRPDFSSRYFSPFNSKTPHKGVAQKVFFQVSGGDPLRDDSFVYEDALREAGIETRLEVYPGVPHGFNNVFPSLSQSAKWNLDFMKGMGFLLGRDITDERLKALTV